MAPKRSNLAGILQPAVGFELSDPDALEEEEEAEHDDEVGEDLLLYMHDVLSTVRVGHGNLVFAEPVIARYFLKSHNDPALTLSFPCILQIIAPMAFLATPSLVFFSQTEIFFKWPKN